MFLMSIPLDEEMFTTTSASSVSAMLNFGVPDEGFGWIWASNSNGKGEGLAACLG